jgi:hypothetical protein
MEEKIENVPLKSIFSEEEGEVVDKIFNNIEELKNLQLQEKKNFFLKINNLNINYEKIKKINTFDDLNNIIPDLYFNYDENKINFKDEDEEKINDSLIEANFEIYIHR